jgi:hypothetical protein
LGLSVSILRKALKCFNYQQIHLFCQEISRIMDISVAAYDKRFRNIKRKLNVEEKPDLMKLVLALRNLHGKDDQNR